MSNLFGNIELAKFQFVRDLQHDKDFIEYRNKSHEFGTLNCSENRFYLYCRLNSADMIKQYCKKYKITI